MLLFFVSGFLQSLDDIPIFFFLASIHSVKYINIIYFIFGSSWLFRIFISYLLDKYQYNIHLSLKLCFLFSTFGWLYVSFRGTFMSSIFVLTLIEYCITYYRTLLQTIAIEDVECFDKLTIEKIGNGIGKIFGCLLSFTMPYHVTFQIIALINAIVFVCFHLFIDPIYRKEREMEPISSSTTTSDQSLHHLLLFLCFLSILPKTDHTHNLWHIHIAGFTESHFIYPITVQELVCVVIIQNKSEWKVHHVILLHLLVLPTISIIRMLSNSLYYPSLTDTWLMITFVLSGIIREITNVTQIHHVRKSSVHRLSAYISLQDSLPVLCSFIGIFVTLGLLEWLNINEKDFHLLIAFHLIYFGLVFVLLLGYYFASA